MKTKFLMAVAACAALAAPGAAMAQRSVIANADLNVRSGPGEDYPVVDKIALDSELLLLGCMEASEWCQVGYGDREGWVSSDFLLAQAEEADMPVVVYEAHGDVLVPTARVRTYIADNPYEPVHVDGEIAVGTSLPDSIEIHEIPDYEYRYVYVNGQPVLVEPQTRRIVYIVR